MITPLRKRNLNSSLCESLPEYPSDDADEESPVKRENELTRQGGGDGDGARGGWGIGGFINKLSDMVNTSLYW